MGERGMGDMVDDQQRTLYMSLVCDECHIFTGGYEWGGTPAPTYICSARCFHPLSYDFPFEPRDGMRSSARGDTAYSTDIRAENTFGVGFGARPPRDSIFNAHVLAATQGCIVGYITFDGTS